MTDAAAPRERADPAESRRRSAGVLLADAVRVLAVVSVVVGTWRFGLVGAALFALVLGGTAVPRLVGVPPLLDAAYSATLLFAAWAAQLGWYEAVGWLDLAVHAVATGLVALVATLALARWGAVGPSSAPHWRVGVGVLVVGLGALGSVLWEVGEWYGHTQLDPTIHVGYDDTLGDLVAGVLGSVLAAVLLARSALVERGLRPGHG
ncbi:hypothetical protein [Cellulomonas massiliensis]|uniref:hypothetical protein n=1 Tax=Cellulomonas massiliensis TaxID=1465811 RepID=UPI0002EA2208|nr:hypothetical protein [Cellulomonas massiliensis]